MDPSSLKPLVHENKVEAQVLGCDDSNSISLREKCVVRDINKESGFSDGVECLSQINTRDSNNGIISTNFW